MAAPHDPVRWLPAARAGSSEALGRVLEACRGYLLQVAREALDPELRAKGGPSDLVQETFLAAQRDFPRFRGDSETELLAWLRRLLRYRLSKHTRRYRTTKKRQVVREIPLDAGGSSGPGGGGPYATTLSPSGEAMGREQEQALQRALDKLPEDYRRVITLRHKEQRSFEEI